MKRLILVLTIGMFSTGVYATHQGMYRAIAIIDMQLAAAGVDASFEEALLLGDPPFCPFPCQYAVDVYAACRFAFPEEGCDWCEEWTKVACRTAYPEEVCDWTIESFNKCIECTELARYFDLTCPS